MVTDTYSEEDGLRARLRNRLSAPEAGSSSLVWGEPAPEPPPPPPVVDTPPSVPQPTTTPVPRPSVVPQPTTTPIQRITDPTVRVADQPVAPPPAPAQNTAPLQATTAPPTYDAPPAPPDVQSAVTAIIQQQGLRANQSSPEALGAIVTQLRAQGINAQVDYTDQNGHTGGILVNGHPYQLIDGNNNWTQLQPWQPGAGDMPKTGAVVGAAPAPALGSMNAFGALSGGGSALMAPSSGGGGTRYYNGNTGATATWNAASNDYVDTNGEHIRPDAIRTGSDAGGDPYGNPNSGYASGTTAAGPGGGAGGGSAYQQQIRKIILDRLAAAQTPVDQNAEGITAPLSAARDEASRTTDIERKAMAERLYAQQGGLGTDELNQGIMQSSERNATGLSQLRAGLISREVDAKRKELSDLLQLATASGDAESARNIQMQMAQLNATVQREGMGLSLAEFQALMNERTVNAAAGR